ncbi:MAG: hypothetical protein JWQ75_3521 [Pseudarthrobacter sp.]|nr:hypothetical protein [Pseudarthrobacter sp.]
MLTAIQKFGPNAIIIALGLAAAVVAAGYGFLGGDGRIGPGFLPTIAGGLMALFAAVNALTSGKKQGATLESMVEERVVEDATADAGPVPADVSAATANAEGTDIYGRTQRQRDKMLWAVTGIVLATVLLVPLLGFLLAFAAMLLVIAVVVERRKIIPSVVVSVLTLAVTYAIFVLFLRVPLPQGILGI